MNVTTWHLVVAMLAGWLNREREKVVDYLMLAIRVDLVLPSPPARRGLPLTRPVATLICHGSPPCAGPIAVTSPPG